MGQTRPLCQEAGKLLIVIAAQHVRRACGRPVLPALHGPAVTILLQLLVDDSRAHLWKLHAGEDYLNIARQLYMTGATTEARGALRLAELALSEVTASDPGGPGVRELRKNIETARAFAANSK